MPYRPNRKSLAFSTGPEDRRNAKAIPGNGLCQTDFQERRITRRRHYLRMATHFRCRSHGRPSPISGLSAAVILLEAT